MTTCTPASQRSSSIGDSTESDPAEPLRPIRIRRLAVNVGSILTGNVVNRATSLIVYAMVGRSLGAREFGQLALAMSLFYLFNSFALLGLDTLTNRAVARDRDQTAKYLVNASALVVVSSLISLLVAWAFVQLIGYPPDTSRVIFLLFVGMIPFTLGQVMEATFLGWERAKYVAYSSSPIWVAQTVIVFWLLRAGHGVDLVALSIAAVHAVVAVIRWFLVLRHIARPRLPVDLRLMGKMLRESGPFLGIQVTGAVHGRINIVLLSAFASEATVGVYGAAQQLLVPTNLIFQSTALGVFPVMVRRFKSGIAGLHRFSTSLIELTLALAIPTVAGTFVLAGPLLLLIYRDPAFMDSEVVLRILIWTTLQTAVTAILGQILWATRREATAFRIGFANTAAQVVLAFVLISRYDAVGAAVATLIVSVLALVQHYVPVAGLFERFSILQGAWKPVVAAVAMTGILLATPGVPVLVRILLGATTYLLVLLGVYLVAGPPGSVRR